MDGFGRVRAAAKAHDRGIMQTRESALPAWPIRLIWLAVFVATAVLFSTVLGCAVPLVAFAAICALRQSRRAALLSVGLLWLAIEAIGFTALHFPAIPSAFGWGMAVGAALLAATGAASAVAGRTRGAMRIVMAFVVTLGLYESILIAITLAVGARLQAYTPGILLQVSFLNAVTFAGLLAVRALKAGFPARHSVSVARI
jgi:hypothetical protein